MTNKNQTNLSIEEATTVRTCNEIINNLDALTAMQLAHYNQDHVKKAYDEKCLHDEDTDNLLRVNFLLEDGYSILAIKSITGWTDASILTRAREYLEENESFGDGTAYSEHGKLVVEFAIAMYGSYDAVDYERTLIQEEADYNVNVWNPWKEAHPLKHLEGWKAEYTGELDVSDPEDNPLADQCVAAEYTKDIGNGVIAVLQSCCHGTCDAIYVRVDGEEHTVAEYGQVTEAENLDVAVAAERFGK